MDRLKASLELRGLSIDQVDIVPLAGPLELDKVSDAGQLRTPSELMRASRTAEVIINHHRPYHIRQASPLCARPNKDHRCPQIPSELHGSKIRWALD